MTSSMFERNIPLRLQNVTKYRVYKILQNRGVEKLSKIQDFKIQDSISFFSKQNTQNIYNQSQSKLQSKLQV